MKKLITFFASGAPGFAVAFALNYLLVKRAHLSVPLAYALTLVVQTTINYITCRMFVFKMERTPGVWRSFLLFANTTLVFRAADWGVYSILAMQLGWNPQATQLFNVALFGVFKFKFFKWVFERNPPPVSENSPGAASAASPDPLDRPPVN